MNANEKVLAGNADARYPDADNNATQFGYKYMLILMLTCVANSCPCTVCSTFNKMATVPWLNIADTA